ncbi:helix-turn-helix transcriptional regulator [Kitasatospora sp. GP82]|uniref:helix-turn-helix domain-containing protein n=1 Tax=Kitasatospora sp. GP82 TaxID=3035089 RepID=UPI0024771131|nr:helix-turn-helix transcriptional regulator [Kitasatospora sp. GP82]MDH6130338.1 transcriptional regulator with XRE-family HTH domain [Kitasatospora sp. GP82]
MAIKDALPPHKAQRIGAELRAIREESGKSLEEVAKSVGRTGPWLSKVERARIPVSQEDVLRMFDYLEVKGRTRDSLESLTTGEPIKQWWRAYDDVLVPGFARYLPLEAAASGVRELSSLVFSGLTQTERSANAVIENIWQKPGADDVDALIEVRMRRQRRLTEDPKLKLHSVFGEAALHIDIGGTEAMREQIEYLLQLSELDNVTIQVVPFKAGRRGVIQVPLILPDFPDPTDPQLAFVEDMSGLTQCESAHEVRRAVRAFNHTQQAALSHDETVAFLQKFMKEHL